MKPIRIPLSSTPILVVICLMAISACSGRKEYAYIPPPPGESLEPLEITFFGHSADTEMYTFFEDSRGSWYADILEQAFNVDLTFSVHGLRESDSAIWISTYADYLSDAAFLYMDPPLGYIGGDANRLYETGITREIPKKLITRNMPGYTAYLNERIVNGWNIMGPTDDTGEGYTSLISVDLYGAIPLDGIAIYREWIEDSPIGDKIPAGSGELILEDPDTYWVDYHMTVDEWEEVLQYLKTMDPDGNGTNDTIPWPALNAHDDTWWSAGIRGVTGRIQGPMIENDSVTYGQISENFKEYCRLLQRWYAAGYLDVFFGMDNWQRYVEKYTAGRMGASPFTTRGAFPLFAENESTRSCLLRLGSGDDIPEDILVFPPLTGADGESGIYGARAITGYRLVISHDTSDEKLERILQIWEFLNFATTEEYILARYGRPGQDFDWTGEAWNSRPKTTRTKKKSNEDVAMGRLPIVLPHGWDKHDFYLRFPRGFADLLTSRLTDETIIRNAWYDDYIASVGTSELARAEHEFAFRLSRATYDYLGRVVRDGQNIDNSWDMYVQMWLRMGGNELIAAAKRDRNWQPEATGFLPIY